MQKGKQMWKVSLFYVKNAKTVKHEKWMVKLVYKNKKGKRMYTIVKMLKNKIKGNRGKTKYKSVKKGKKVGNAKMQKGRKGLNW